MSRYRLPGLMGLLVTLASLALLGCRGPKLMPTPLIYIDAETDPFGEVPPHFRNNKVDVLYATDRKREEGEEGNVGYSHGRSHSLAFGSCTVEIGEGVSWEALVQDSQTAKRSNSLPLLLREVRELGRFPETPLPFIVDESGVRDDPEARARHDSMADEFRAEVRRRLDLTSRKEAYVHLHGVSCDFETATYLIAGFWHFLGRSGVPITYTWPAGSGGIAGYFYDRESGEFTIHHLKEFIRLLSSCPELEKIHLLAHSRGTDVCTSALRELFIQARAAGADPKALYKIGNLVLLAPDLDEDVVMQRFAAERIGLGVERLTIYVSEGDRTIGLTGRLFGSQQRLALLRPEDLTDSQRRDIEKARWVDIIDVHAATGFTGHNYYHASPEVSSDLMLMLRYDRKPGKENGRPLVERDARYWELHEGYPKEPAD